MLTGQGGCTACMHAHHDILRLAHAVSSIHGLVVHAGVPVRLCSCTRELSAFLIVARYMRSHLGLSSLFMLMYYNMHVWQASSFISN